MRAWWLLPLLVLQACGEDDDVWSGGSGWLIGLLVGLLLVILLLGAVRRNRRR